MRTGREGDADMWKDYSVNFIRKNRASSIAIMSAALIASLLLSLLCSFFYNIWVYDVESAILEEGDWHARITGAVSEEDLSLIRSFANVKKAVVSNGAVTDVYFYQPHTVHQDMTLMSEKLGLGKDQITYNSQLLSMYLIRIPGDDKPRMLLPFYMSIVLTACFSLILVIHNSFAVSMNARIRQLGILSSIGATPRQIRTCLMQEAAALCVLPVMAGSLAGIGIGCGMIHMMNVLAVQMAGRRDVAFRYHPLVFGLTVLASALTVLVSAWIPAGKLSKLTPLEAIRGGEEMQLRRKKHSPVLSLLFGIEGELAGNALKAQRRALRSSTLSLTLSFLGFTVMLCFFKLSDISTDYTYFARYQNVWDVMATVKNVKIEDFELISGLRKTLEGQGASGCVVYQKLSAMTQVLPEEISDELDRLGGPQAVAGGNVTMEKADGAVIAGQDLQEGSMDCKRYFVEAPIVILDDVSFREYCGQIGISPRLDGAVVLNRIWDSVNSNFRYPEYIPYIKGNKTSAMLQWGLPWEAGADGYAQEPGAVEVLVLGCTDRAPLLREEYDDYALVHVLPLSLWKEIAGKMGRTAGGTPDVYIRVLMAAQDKISLAGLNNIEEVLMLTVGQAYETETENRIQEKLTNDRVILGYKVVIGIFCGLLAIIGIANIFSFTMGFLRQRRREFARYFSVGMSTDGLKKIFLIEILVIAGRPVLFTFPVTVLGVSLMIRASYLDPVEFWTQAPYAPIVGFVAVVFGFVAVAYAIGGRRILQDSLAEALRDDATEFF